MRNQKDLNINGFVLFLLILLHPVISSPSGSELLAPNRTPSAGQIGAYFFESSGESQVWINLEPQSPGGGPAPIRLNFTVKFRGSRLDQTPDSVEVLAKPAGGAYSLMVRQPVLRFRSGEGKELDLTASGKEFRFFPSCTDCPADTVVAQIPLDALRRMAQSDIVEIDALGFTVRLDSAGLQALQKFLRTVRDGIEIKTDVPPQ